MARFRRKVHEHGHEGETKPQVKAMPAVCPLCGVSSSDEMTTHLQSHAPGEMCLRCNGQEKSWRLDLDGSTHFRPDVSLFYCSNCGRYGPIEPQSREEVN